MGDVFLDPRVICPGDVLVTLGRGPVSRLIAARTGGSFSHAALCLTPILVYEARRDGVYTTPLDFACITDRGGAARFVMRPARARRARLLRHPSLAGSVGDDFAELGAEYFSRPYSDLARLLRALPASDPLRRIGERLARRSPSARDRGVFCSELIAEIYESLGIALFPPGRRPAEVSPAALAEESALQDVPGAVLQGRRRPCTDVEKAKLLWPRKLISRADQADSHRKIARLQKKTAEAIRRMSDR